MEVLIYIAVVVGGILLLRGIGAWMLRIDEVIKNQKLLIEEIRKISNKNL